MAKDGEVENVPDGNIAATYALIYNFLKLRDHDKAAAALKKSVKDVVVLKDDVPEVEGTPLDEIVKQWKASHDGQPSSSSSSSSESSSESSESDDDDSDSSSSSEDDSSSDSDSSGSPESGKLPPSQKAPNLVTSPIPEPKGSEQGLPASPQSSTRTMSSGKAGSSDAGSSSSSDSESESASSSSEDSSSDDESESSSSSDPGDSVVPNGKKMSKAITPTTAKPQMDTSDSSSDSDSSSSSSSDGKSKRKTKKPKVVKSSEEVLVTKKRKTSESGTAVVTATTTVQERTKIVPNGQDAVSSTNGNGRNRKGANGKPPRKSNQPFQKFKVDAIQFADERLMDNSFTAKGGTTNDYGERAHKDLIVTRGAGFRKEKNKKKRGSYRGGEITMESHSIKFD